MKRFFSIFLAICFTCINLVATASKPYIHPDFDLSKVKEIQIMQIQDLQKDLAQNFTPDKAAEQKIFSAVLEAASRKNIIITDKRDNDVSGEKVFSSHTPKVLKLCILINNFGYKTIEVPGYYETITVNETRSYYDYHGVRHTYTEPVEKQQWVEGYSYKNAYLNLVYNFYDVNSNTMVASFSDNRVREYEVDPANGMLGRSTRECFKKILKK